MAGGAQQEGMTIDEPILNRVRKLLGLAQSPNVHEAASAAAMAQQLIERHRLERWLDAERVVDADPFPIEDDRERPLEVARKLRKWRVVLATALADANGCVAYRLDRGADQAIVLVGRAPDREAVHTLWAWLVKRIEWLSATHGAGQRRKWHDAFRIGAVSAIAERLAQSTAEVRAEQTAGALMRIDPVALAQREALETYVLAHLRLGRGRAMRVDADGWQRGRAAGETLPIV